MNRYKVWAGWIGVCVNLNKSWRSLLLPGLEGGDSLFEGSVALDVGIVADSTSAVSEEALVDALEGGVFLSSGLLDSVLVVLVVLVLG